MSVGSRTLTTMSIAETLSVGTRMATELKRPSMYSVIMLNDDYTPMEFVVEVLQKFFNKDPEQATQIMLTVHTKGSAVCAIYTKDVAETKAAIVNQYSRDCQHPLMCEIAPADDGE